MSGADKQQWARVCAELQATRRAANRLGLRPRFDEVIRATRAGKTTLAAWRALTDEINRLEIDEEQAGMRHGDSDGPVHRCPRELCDKEVRPYLGVTPTCDLFGTEMVERDVS